MSLSWVLGSKLLVSGRNGVQEKNTELEPPSEIGLIRELTRAEEGESFNTLGESKSTSVKVPCEKIGQKALYPRKWVQG